MTGIPACPQCGPRRPRAYFPNFGSIFSANRTARCPSSVLPCCCLTSPKFVIELFLVGRNPIARGLRGGRPAARPLGRQECADPCGSYHARHPRGGRVRLRPKQAEELLTALGGSIIP